jgi:hypothetical protein
MTSDELTPRAAAEALNQMTREMAEAYRPVFEQLGRDLAALRREIVSHMPGSADSAGGDR